MSVSSRPFAPGDLRQLLELCQARWPEVRCTFGQIAFWSQTLRRDDWEARLWFEDERLVGWGWRTSGDFEFDGSDGMVDEIVAWGQPEIVLARTEDAALLARHGLEHDPDGPWYRVNARRLESIEAPVVPPGYRLTTMARCEDLASRSAAHRSAFAPGSRFFDDAYAAVREAWPYRPELDVVCLAPDGSVASFALAWHDERNRLGELEPVGTHERHRRLGLARAVSLDALRRLRAAGAERALVQSSGDPARPGPSRLYESIGFRTEWRALTFRRTPREPPAGRPA